jgi:hypothetical protein
MLGPSVQRDHVEHDRHKDPPLSFGQLLLDRAAQSGEQILPLRLVSRLETEPIGEPLPVLGLQRHRGRTPEVPTDLARNLKDLYAPGAALAGR